MQKGGYDEITIGYIAYLAQQKFNIYLMTYSNSESIQSQLNNLNYEVKIKLSVKNFSEDNQKEVFEKIEEELKELDVSLLIFNCQFGNDNQKIIEYHENSLEQINEMISTNCLAPVMITRKLMKKMLERKNQSGILMLTSAAGYRPLPYINIYSAIKHMQDMFAQALGLEYQNRIDICSVKTCWFKGGIYSTISKKQDNEIPNNIFKYFVISDLQFAKLSLEKLGILNEGEASLKHKIANYFIRLSSDKALYNGFKAQYAESKKNQ